MSAVFTKLILFITLIIMLIQSVFGSIFGGNKPPETTTTEPSTTVVETTTKPVVTTPPQTETTTEESTEPSTTEPVTEPSTTEPVTKPTTAPAEPDTTATTKPSVSETTTIKPTASTTKTTAEFGTRFNSATHEKTVEFGGKSINVFNAVDKTADGGFVACGITTSTDGIFADIASTSWATNFSFVVRYDKNLKVKWVKAIGFDKIANYNNIITFEDIAVLSDGSIVAVGYSSAKDISYNTQTEKTVDSVIYKFSASGEIIFQKTFGGTETDAFYSVDKTANGFVVGGSTDSHNHSFSGIPGVESSAIIINFDNDGNILWNKYLSGNRGGVISGISTDKDGNIFVTCVTDSTTGNFDAFPELSAALINTVVIKYNYAGDYQWYYPIASSAKDIFDSIVADDQGGCVVAGYYEYLSYHLPDGTLDGIHNCGGTDALAFRLNSDGSVKWTKIISGYENDYITGIDKTAGGFAVCGYTYSSNREFSGINNKGNGDAFAVFLTPAGNIAELLSVGGSRTDNATCIAVNKDGIAAMLGKTVSNDGSFSSLNAHLTDGYIDLFKKIFSGSEPFTCFAVKYSTTIKKF